MLAASLGLSCARESVPASPSPEPIPICTAECTGLHRLRDCESVPDDFWDAGDLSRALKYRDDDDSSLVCENGVETQAPFIERPEREIQHPKKILRVRGRFSLDFPPPPDLSCIYEYVDISETKEGDLYLSGRTRPLRCAFERRSSVRKSFYSTQATPEAADSLRIEFSEKIQGRDGVYRQMQCNSSRFVHRVSADNTKEENEPFRVSPVDVQGTPPDFSECCSLDDEGREVLINVRIREGELHASDLCLIAK